MAKRVADPNDPLRTLLEIAREWHVPPTVVLGDRTVNTNEWTTRDVDYMVALKVYEASLCPGGDHVLAETSKDEHADAYRPGDRIECHKCKARARLDEVLSKDEDSAGVLVPLVLDADVVALNLLPVPELPPELRVE